MVSKKIYQIVPFPIAYIIFPSSFLIQKAIDLVSSLTDPSVLHLNLPLVRASRGVNNANLCREEMKKYVDEKKEQKRQALLQSDVTNIGDDKDEDMEKGEATE
ncbi:hypothetical protein H5410_002014 [Solanum commersonii]|uniref:Uncharacterized protein n=1 Tax=Solanum commersonii TaxID=4109 RepID=A0A9J6B0S9_SOLCO|nr:hypothetical protein H5410_002014 [Solanum commersonii]